MSGIVINKTRMIKYIALGLCLLLCLTTFCSCSTKGKSALVSYAKKNYGKCKFIREEVSSNANGKVRTVYLKDKDTGIEYKVTSGMHDLNIDGSSFGHTENTSSDFIDLYWDYVRDEAADELDEIAKKYDVDLSENGVITFNNRPASDEPEAAAKAVYKAFKDHDVKGLLEITLLVYSEDGHAYLGVLEGATGTWSGNDSYGVIDYVQSVFPNATYSSDIFGIPESYVNSDDLDRLISKGGKNSTNFDVEFYFFKDPDYGTLVAFDMKDMGLDGYFIGTYESYGGGKTLDCEVLGIHH